MAGAAVLGLSRELRTRPVRNRPCTSRWGQVRHRPVATYLASARPPRLTHLPRATGVASYTVTLPGGGLLVHDVGVFTFAPDGSIFENHGPKMLFSMHVVLGPPAASGHTRSRRSAPEQHLQRRLPGKSGSMSALQGVANLGEGGVEVLEQ